MPRIEMPHAMIRVRCWFGWHSWTIVRARRQTYRLCSVCRKWQAQERDDEGFAIERWRTLPESDESESVGVRTHGR